MGRLSTRSNPTNLKEVDRSRINISVTDGIVGRQFTLDRLNLDGLNLAPDLKLICVAHAGSTAIRYPLGTAESWSREAQSLEGLDRAGTLRFRILLHEEGSPRIVASAENVRPMDDSQSESLLPMEPAELGERLWKLDIRPEGPVLLFNSTIFPSAAGVENFGPFGPLVLPEALHQVMRVIADDVLKLDDEGDAWSAWGQWLDSIGIGRPPEEEEEREKWCNEVTAIFCDKHKFGSRLRILLVQGGGE